MQKPCPTCRRVMRRSHKKIAGSAKTGIQGSLKNPIVLRCTFCRKDYEIRGGKLVKKRPGQGGD